MAYLAFVLAFEPQVAGAAVEGHFVIRARCPETKTGSLGTSPSCLLASAWAG